MTPEEEIKVIEDLIQLAKDYAADEGASADNDPEILKAYELIEWIK